MSNHETPAVAVPKRPHARPFRRAVFSGLAVVMPPLLTIVLFLWAWNTIESYVLAPAESTARMVISWSIAEIRDRAPEGTSFVDPDDPDKHQRVTDRDMRTWVRVRNRWIPEEVYREVEEHPRAIPPVTAAGYYDQYVQTKYLRRSVVLPIFLLVFVLVLYLLGKFVARGVGRMLWIGVERVVARLPIVSNVYSSVKQVTDFAFQEKETEIQFTRIVAVQYPRQGLWAIGFLTGDGIPDVASAIGEPVVSVLVPTSPMPATGFTIVVPRKDVIELSISVDQAIQFCVSCGVVCPLPPTAAGVSAAVRGDRTSEAILKQIEHVASAAPTGSAASGSPVSGATPAPGGSASPPASPGLPTTSSPPHSET